MGGSATHVPPNWTGPHAQRLYFRTFRFLLKPLRALRSNLQHVDRRTDVFAASFDFRFNQPANSGGKPRFPEAFSLLG
jgi:hypothetical protein